MCIRDSVSVTGVSTFSNAVKLEGGLGNLTVEGNTGLTIKNANPTLIFTDTDNNPDFSIRGNGGQFRIRSDSQTADRLIVDNQGNFDILQNLDVRRDLDVDGHTNLDNVSIAGVVTATSFSGPATQVTVADESSDTSCNVLFTTAATGNLPPKTGTNLTFNSSTGNLTATKFTGDGSGLTGVTASGSGVIVQHDGSNIGTAGTINFSTNLDVSAISAGIVTITASGGGFSQDAQGNLLAGTNAGNSLDGSSAEYNILLGQGAGESIDGDDNNIAIGYDAGKNNTASSNIFMGRDAAKALSSSLSSQNIFIGHEVVSNKANVSGTVVGAQAGIGNGTGINLTLFGYRTGGNSYNSTTFIGHQAGRSATSACDFTTAVGANALYNNAGRGNVAIGNLSGQVLTSGRFNTIAGYMAGRGGLSGTINYTDCVAIGSSVAVDLSSANNVIVIGANANPSSNTVTNEITLGNENITKLRVPGIGVTFKDNGGTPTQGHVLTVDANGEASFAAASGGGGGTNVGITTNLSGSFTASAGSASTINTLTGYSSNDLVVEYTIYIKNGSDFQSQKLLAMRYGTTIHSTQFAVMFSSSLLVQCDATISSGNILLRAIPETGVSGSTTYKIKREVM